MIYLSGVDCQGARSLAESYPVGLIVQPGSYGAEATKAYPYFAADNGCFTNTWDETTWLRWLDRLPRERALWAVVPDVVCDWQATRDRWWKYWTRVRDMGFTPCYVLQNGQPLYAVPTDGPVFVGGDTEWKLGTQAAALTMIAEHAGQPVHLGRCNSLRRLKRAAEMHVSSVDGTFLKFAPEVNTPRLKAWLDSLPRDTQYALA